MFKLWIFMAGLALLALSGCPRPQGDKTDVSVTETSPAPQTVVVGDGTEAEVIPESEAPKVAGGEVPGNTAHRPSTKELEGKWFALYGGTGLGAKTYTFEHGHQLDFLDNGMAIWSLSGSGGNGIQVLSKYELTTGEITLTVDKPESLTQGVDETPLSFGRDDEVGLVGASGEQPPALFRFKPELDGGFLALKGYKGELMVYGRVDNPNAASAPDVSGDWKLTSSPSAIDDVKVKMLGEQMEVNWGPYHNVFKGNYTHGYFVGPVSSSAGLAYAAVMPAAGGKLDGAISTEPYSDWLTTFDFSRATQ